MYKRQTYTRPNRRAASVPNVALPGWRRATPSVACIVDTSGSARYASFLRALDDTPRIVLGNRSAIYTPAHRLGAILLWDCLLYTSRCV